MSESFSALDAHDRQTSSNMGPEPREPRRSVRWSLGAMSMMNVRSERARSNRPCMAYQWLLLVPLFDAQLFGLKKSMKKRLRNTSLGRRKLFQALWSLPSMGVLHGAPVARGEHHLTRI